MNTTNHTPGPWWLDDDGFIAAGFGDEYKTIADPRCMPSQGNESEIDGNSALIAAAPDMFDALQAMVDAFGDQDSLLMDQCKAALSKAKGESK